VQARDEVRLEQRLYGQEPAPGLRDRCRTTAGSTRVAAAGGDVAAAAPGVPVTGLAEVGPSVSVTEERNEESLSSNMSYRLVMKAHRQLGIAKNVHAYRKVFTSKLIESGLNLLEVQSYTRHRDVSQLQVYYERLDKAKTLPTYYGRLTSSPFALRVSGAVRASRESCDARHDAVYRPHPNILRPLRPWARFACPSFLSVSETRRDSYSLRKGS